jgi:hypothetical protein
VAHVRVVFHCFLGDRRLVFSAIRGEARLTAILQEVPGLRFPEPSLEPNKSVLVVVFPLHDQLLFDFLVPHRASLRMGCQAHHALTVTSTAAHLASIFLKLNPLGTRLDFLHILSRKRAKPRGV